MAVTSVDVFYALLALDAYNRHENSNLRKIGTLTDIELDSQVGAVTFVKVG